MAEEADEDSNKLVMVEEEDTCNMVEDRRPAASDDDKHAFLDNVDD